MNERIKELARQSGATDENGSRATTVYCFTEQELKGFAELIVRECMMVCQNTSIREDDGQTFVYSDAIQEHFRS